MTTYVTFNRKAFEQWLQQNVRIKYTQLPTEVSKMADEAWLIPSDDLIKTLVMRGVLHPEPGILNTGRWVTTIRTLPIECPRCGQMIDRHRLTDCQEGDVGD